MNTLGLHLQLWAKSDPHHLLWRHLLDVAAVVESLWPRFRPLGEMPVRWACYICALHDVGKADPWFQNKDDKLAGDLRKTGLELPVRLDTTPPDILHFRHEARSRKWMLDYLPAHHGWDKRAARIVTHALNGHHGNFSADCYSEGDRAAQHATWQPLRDELAQSVWRVLQPPPYAPVEFRHASALGIALAGLIVLTDWIASNHALYDYRTLQAHDDPAKYFEAAQKLANGVVARLELNADEPQHDITPPLFGAVWRDFAGALRPSQRALEAEVLAGRVAPGLAILEAPMGEGKTEAAIYLAEWWNMLRGKSGAYFALPTQATSNQMHGRYAKYLQSRRAGAAPRLVHGMAWLLDDASVEATAQTFGDGDERLLSREWFRPLRRALLAPDGVGTVDQALLSALHVKFGFLRLLGLRAKVLVVDEAHAYDAYMTTILERLLQWCRALEIPVILLSATLSARQKHKLVAAYGGAVSSLDATGEEAYPLLTLVPLDGAPRTVNVERDPQRDRELHLKPHSGLLDDTEKIARLALARVQNGGCACVLMNTVKGAQNVYRAIEALLKRDEFSKPDELRLFHARFRAAQRKGIEDAVSELFGKDATIENGRRPRRAIVVATQVVEQSLDVDFDFFITQLAPIDLLLQRSGRLWRHDRSQRFGAAPTLEVLLPAEGSLQFGVAEKIYAREVLLRTLVALHHPDLIEVRNEWQVIKLPGKFRPLIEAVYGETTLDSDVVPREEIEKAARERERTHNENENAAKTHLLPTPNEREFSLARRAVGESEGEGEAANYFRASTRLGDDSRAALVLRDDGLIALAGASSNANQKPPSRAKLRRLFEHKVNLPAWWLRETSATTGWNDVFDGENWLRGHVIVPLRGDEWHAHNGALIRDDPTLGLVFIAHQTEKEEADAGIAN